MQGNQFQGACMTYAVFDDGTKAIVQFWVPQGGEAAGFGIQDGRMVRLDVRGGFQRYEVA